MICLLIINHFPFHCNSIFVRFCFIQRGTPRCRIFRHSAIPPFRFSTTPPFYHSIEWRHPVELNVSYFGPCSLRKVSGSSEQLLLIKMVRWSIFKWIKFFFKVSTMYRSNLFTFSARKKSLFQLRAGDATVKLFWDVYHLL